MSTNFIINGDRRNKIGCIRRGRNYRKISTSLFQRKLGITLKMLAETSICHRYVRLSRFPRLTKYSTNLFWIQIIKLLQDCDERFQLLLIGFQTIFDDHIKKQPHMDLEKFNPLLDVFLRAKENAQKVLCEIRTALQKLGSTTVIIEPKSIQSSKSSDLIFYDWVIFREYINQLEHINEVVTVIRENLV